nr:hypothetical protein [Paenibacillus antibioticophila]
MSIHLIAQACGKRQSIKMGDRRKVGMIRFGQLTAAMDEIANTVFY